VRDRLVGADRPPELLAVAGVLHRHLQRALRDAGQLGRHRQQRRADARPGLALECLAGPVRADAGEAAGGVHRRDRLDLGGRALDHAHAVGAAERDHLGLGAVGHEPGLVAVQHPGRGAQLARGDPRQPALLLLLRAGRLDHQAGRGVRQERQRRQRVAELLHQDDQLDHAEPLAAVLLVDEDARPAELAELLPSVLVVAPGLGQLAHVLELEAVGEQVLGGALDRLLVV
jgi:hypothetical protein